MTNRSHPITDFQATLDPIPSLATYDPAARLGVAMVIQAIKDLTHPDPIRAIDALAWWLGDGPEFVNTLLDLDLDPLSAFCFAAGGCTYDKKRFLHPGRRAAADS